MAAVLAQSAAFAAKSQVAAKPQARFNGLARVALPTKVQESAFAVSNGSKVNAMMVWQPVDNKMFETFSFLPPLSDGEISRQIDYITSNGYVPCLEFAEAELAYIKSDACVRMGAVTSNYYDNRYWTMYKLPMFGCTDSSQVLAEIANCTKTFPDAYVRVVAFDSQRQVQICGFLVHRPASAKDYRSPEGRSK